MAEKECSICHKNVALEFFENDKRRPDGKGPRCKECVKTSAKARKEKAKEPGIKIVKKEDKCVVGFPMKAKCEPLKQKKKEPHVKATNECDCGHLIGSHIFIMNPDGPGDRLSCWKGIGKDRCPCRNYSHNGRQYGEILNA